MKKKCGCTETKGRRSRAEYVLSAKHLRSWNAGGRGTKNTISRTRNNNKGGGKLIEGGKGQETNPNLPPKERDNRKSGEKNKTDGTAINRSQDEYRQSLGNCSEDRGGNDNVNKKNARGRLKELYDWAYKRDTTRKRLRHIRRGRMASIAWEKYGEGRQTYTFQRNINRRGYQGDENGRDFRKAEEKTNEKIKMEDLGRNGG